MAETVGLTPATTFLLLSMQMQVQAALMEVFSQLFVFFLFTTIWVVPVICDGGDSSAVGDPGMRRDGLRVALEAWNFCNEVGEEAPGMGSPRAADCFDLSGNNPLAPFAF